MEQLTSVVAHVLDGLDGFEDFEDKVFQIACRVARELGAAVLDAFDEELMRTRPAGSRVVGMRQRRIATRFGQLTIRRRLYAEGAGKAGFLLDSALGLAPRDRLSPAIARAAVKTAASSPYRQAAAVLNELLPEPISAMAVHAVVRRTGQANRTQQQRQATDLFDLGLAPEGASKKAPTLCCEADGAVVNLQRERARRTEMKLAVFYEGKDGPPHRRRLKGRRVHAEICASADFWRRAAAQAAQTYDVTATERTLLGGDGASWVRGGLDALPGSSSFVLDPFHVKRALLVATADMKVAGHAFHLVYAQGLVAADDYLVRFRDSHPDRTEEIEGVRAYLAANQDGLWQPEGGLGAIEGNVDKVVACRFKKRGMRWTVAGANNLVSIIALRENGQLEDFLRARTGTHEVNVPATKRARKVVIEQIKDDPAAWMTAHMPALSGPHSDRPWAQALREIARIPAVGQ